MRRAEMRRHRQAVEHVQRQDAFERDDRRQIHASIALAQHLREAPQQGELRLVEIDAELIAAGVEARLPAALVGFGTGHVSWQPAQP